MRGDLTDAGNTVVVDRPRNERSAARTRTGPRGPRLVGISPAHRFGTGRHEQHGVMIERLPRKPEAGVVAADERPAVRVPEAEAVAVKKGVGRQEVVRLVSAHGPRRKGRTPAARGGIRGPRGGEEEDAK